MLPKPHLTQSKPNLVGGGCNSNRYTFCNSSPAHGGPSLLCRTNGVETQGNKNAQSSIAKYPYYHTNISQLTVYYSTCNRIVIESNATHYFQRPPFCSLLYRYQWYGLHARPSPDYAHLSPRGLGAKVTRVIGRPLSNLRISLSKHR